MIFSESPTQANKALGKTSHERVKGCRVAEVKRRNLIRLGNPAD